MYVTRYCATFTLTMYSSSVKSPSLGSELIGNEKRLKSALCDVTYNSSTLSQGSLSISEAVLFYSPAKHVYGMTRHRSWQKAKTW